MTINGALRVLEDEVGAAIEIARNKIADLQSLAWDDAIGTHGADILANHESLVEDALRSAVRDTVEAYLKANLDI